MAAGRFTIEQSPTLPDDFNLEQIQGDPPPPDDQWGVCTDVYKTKNVLWLLKTRGAFAGDDDAFKSYLERLKLAAQTGCVYNPVVPAKALEALIEIRDDIVARKGRPAKYRYLTRVAFWAAAFIVAALLAMNGLRELPQVTLPPFAVGAMSPAGVPWRQPAARFHSMKCRNISISSSSRSSASCSCPRWPSRWRFSCI